MVTLGYMEFIFRIVLVYGPNHHTRLLGHIYMDWNQPALVGELMRLVGTRDMTIYVHI